MRENVHRMCSELQFFSLDLRLYNEFYVSHCKGRSGSNDGNILDSTSGEKSHNASKSGFWMQIDMSPEPRLIICCVWLGNRFPLCSSLSFLMYKMEILISQALGRTHHIKCLLSYLARVCKNVFKMPKGVLPKPWAAGREKLKWKMLTFY